MENDNPICPHCGKMLYETKKFRNPFPTTDVLVKYGEGIVLIKRKNPPYGWAIPGGFIDYGESAEDAAVREMQEETNLELKNLKLFTVRSKPDRDPRFHTLTVVYTAEGVGKLKAGDDAGKAGIFNLNNLPDQIAFDHREVIQMYYDSLK